MKFSLQDHSAVQNFIRELHHQHSLFIGTLYCVLIGFKILLHEGAGDGCEIAREPLLCIHMPMFQSLRGIGVLVIFVSRRPQESR